MTKSIFDFVPPGWTLMPHQVKFLREYELIPNHIKIVCGDMPVASGKTILSFVVAAYEAWKRGRPSTILTRDNTLVAQYRDTRPALPVMLAPYRGAMSERDWEQTRHVYDSASVRVSNFFSHLALRAYPECLVIDEAHQTGGVLSDMESVKLWKHLHHYPDGLWTLRSIIEWLDHEHDRPEARTELKKALKLINRDADNITFEHGAMEYGRNKEVQEYLKILPLTPKNNRPVMWPPSKVKRIVLMSATLAQDDLEDIGLHKLPARWLRCDSPIPVERRPAIYEPFGDMSFFSWRRDIQNMANGINWLGARHAHERGLIHTTYGMASSLTAVLRDTELGKRLICHTQLDKAAKLREWQATPNGILVAAGMAEGLDLAYDKARWQVISKIVWPNKMERAIEAKMETRPEWYGWETLKLVMQQYGRVCRRPDDEGVTYICDSQFEKLMRKSGHLASPWFKEALR